jgi:hypothetical protein
MEFGQQFLNVSKRAGFFYMPQSWDMGEIILLPKEGMLSIFPAGKNPTASVGSEPAILGTRGQLDNH